MAHEPTVCTRINSSMDFHGKSYSYRHECPACGRARRYNSNFLGSRFELVCDGAKITRCKRDGRRPVVAVLASDSPLLDTLVILPLGRYSDNDDRRWAVQNGRGEVIVHEPGFTGPHRLYCHGCKSNTCGHVVVVQARLAEEAIAIDGEER